MAQAHPSCNSFSPDALYVITLELTTRWSLDRFLVRPDLDQSRLLGGTVRTWNPSAGPLADPSVDPFVDPLVVPFVDPLEVAEAEEVQYLVRHHLR